MFYESLSLKKFVISSNCPTGPRNFRLWKKRFIVQNE